MTLRDDPLIEAAEKPVVPIDVGQVIAGKYKIGGIIGYGGMATVAAAHHLELDQPVAIKFLHSEGAARPDAVRRFLSEARAAARLNSPHVARVLDVGTTPTARGGIVPYMVMERLEGMDLDAMLGLRGPLPVSEAVEYVLQACAGVAEAHALEIIHRDLKPGNLFVTRRRDGAPVVKLLDFGISKSVARRSGADATALTADREMMGSPRYMSPEQVRSSKDVDARTDVWSLGVVLHELLAGVAPFRAENVADTLVAILHEAPRPIASTAPDVPRKLVEVVTRCLQKDRQARYATVDELAAALLPFRSAVPLLIAPLPELGVDDARNAEAGVSAHTVRALPRSRVMLTGALSFAAVGLVLIAVLVFTRLRTAAPSPDSTTRAQAAPLAADEARSAPLPATPLASASALGAVTSPADTPMEELPDDGTTTPAGRPVKSPGASRSGGKLPGAKPGGSASPRHRTDW